MDSSNKRTMYTSARVYFRSYPLILAKKIEAIYTLTVATTCIFLIASPEAAYLYSSAAFAVI